MRRYRQKGTRSTSLRKSHQGRTTMFFGNVCAFERLERRDLLNGEWDGCVVETGPDGQHHITGSCPALNGGSDGDTNAGDSTSVGTGGDDWPYGGTETDHSGWDPALDFDPSTDPWGTDDTASSDNFSDYQETGDYSGEESFGDPGWTEDPWFDGSANDPDPSEADHSGEFIGVASEGIVGLDGPGFGSVLRGGDADQYWLSHWYNEEAPTDVNDDGQTSPQDALLLINELNARGSRQLSAPLPIGSDGEGESGRNFFLDSNGDRWLSPADVLAVVNQLVAAGSRGGGEGEASGTSGGHDELVAVTLPPSTAPSHISDTPRSAVELVPIMAPEPNAGQAARAGNGPSAEPISAATWEVIGRTTILSPVLDESLLLLLASSIPQP